MRNLFTVLIAGMVATTSLAAQHAGIINTGPLPAPINAAPFGNVMFPGGIFGPSGHVTNLSNTVAGRPPIGVGLGRGVGLGHPGFPGRGGFGGGFDGRRGRTLVVPYAVPVGYFGGGYYSQPEPVTIVVPQAPTPTVIINQSFAPQTANPVLRDYSNSDLPETSRSDVQIHQLPVAPRAEGQPLKTSTRAAVDDQATIYLIALKDESIRQAVGYWVEGQTLHYVTPGGTINRVTLDQVDRETSERLNRERKVDFSLRR